MINHQDSGQLWVLIFNILDNLEELERTKVLTDVIWEINSDRDKLQNNWRRTEVILKSYEKYRDETLEASLSNVKELVNALSGSSFSN